ncbi:MAG: hypothetical protein AAFQ73_06310 [Pseudomonadota bacterium]
MRMLGMLACRLLKAVQHLALAAVFGVATNAHAQDLPAQLPGGSDALGGGYFGIETASGWRMSLMPNDSGFDAVFTDRAGRDTAFVAEGDANAAAGQVEIAGSPALFAFSPRPIGMVLFWFPVSADGKVQTTGAKPYLFLRDGETLPEQPALFQPPPKELGERVDPFVFLYSYQFWTPSEVGRGYMGMRDRHRALIRLYAHVHTDILWRLCQSTDSPVGRAEALEGQNITCEGVIDIMDDVQRRGQFAAYKQGLSEEREKLLDAVRCSQGGLSQETCVLVSQWTARAAVSLETAQTILSRY